jgi:hypothetical protein
LELGYFAGSGILVGILAAVFIVWFFCKVCLSESLGEQGL